MNLSAIVPLAGAGPTASGAKAGLPAGSPSVFATQFAACCDVTSTTTAAGTGDGEAGDAVTEDLLTLAALASRTASAALPLAPVAELAPNAASGDDVAIEDLVLPAVLDAAPDGTAATVDGELELSIAAGEAGIPQEPAADVVDADAGAVDADAGAVDADAGAVDADAGAVDADAGAVAPTPAASASAADVTDDPSVAPPLAEEHGGPAGLGGREVVAPGSADGADVTRTSVSIPADGEIDAAGDDQLTRTIPAAGPARGRGRADEAATPQRLTASGTVRTEGADALVQTGSTTAATARHDPLTPSAAAQRVLDIVTQLEDAPPPRVVVIETGEVRVRVGLDAGVVRLTVLGTLGEGGEEILREAAAALESGGFGTELDRGHDQPDDHHPEDGTSSSAATATSTRPSSRSRAGLQL